MSEPSADGAADTRPRFRRTEVWQTGLLAMLVTLGVLSVALVHGHVGGAGFALVLVLSVALLATHSITVEVGSEVIEVRLGNGMLRRHRSLDRLRAVRCEEGFPCWGMGFARAGEHVFGLGGTSRVELRWDDGTRWVIGLREGDDLTVELRARIQDTDASAGTEGESR